MGKSCWNRPSRIPNRSKCRNKHMAAEWLHFFSGPFCPFFSALFLHFQNMFFTPSDQWLRAATRFQGRMGKRNPSKRQNVKNLLSRDRYEMMRKIAPLKTFDDTSFSINALLILIARMACQSIVSLIVILRLDFWGKSHWFWGHFWPTPHEVRR